MSPYSIPTFIGAILVFLIGVFVFKQNKKSGTNISFTLFCLSVFIWLFSYTIAYSAKSFEIVAFFCNLACTAVIFTAPTFYHFSVEQLGFRKLKKTIIIPYMITVIFTPFFLMTNYFLGKPHKTFWGYYSTAGPLHPVYLLMHITIVGLGFALLFTKYFKNPEITLLEKRRLKYIFVSYVLAAIGAVDFTQKYGADFYPFGFIFIVAFVIVTAYAILRYRLLDIKLIFRKTMAYSLSAGFLTAFFAIVVITITNLLSSYAHVSSLKISILAALVIAILFNPLRNRIQKVIDKVFYKKTYDYMMTVNKISHDLASMIDLRKILNFVGDTIFSTLGLKNIYLLAAGPGGDFEVVYNMSYGEAEGTQTTGLRLQNTPLPPHPPLGKGGQEGGKGETPPHLPLPRGGEGGVKLKIDGHSDMVRLLKTSDDIVIKDELPGIVEIIGQETIDSISNTMRPFNGEVIAPVFIDDKLSLLIVLGGKISGDIFTDEDVNLLKTVSNQTAIAIKNAGLYAEKLRSERFASMGLMSATFAHEIRNPLTSIKTFAQLFPEKFKDTEFREVFSKVVIDDVERIDNLIKDLLNFSGEKTFSRMDEVDIISLIDEILNYLKSKLGLESKKISVEKIYKDVKINILGDSEKLKQAFINIIINGCQAMDENGVLKVNIAANGRKVDIAISDTGKGISHEETDKIFDPFYTTKPLGMGLGLAISKKIIEDHGGKIEVESEISKGTTFTVSLPMQTTEK